ncbi:MAG TPA: PQQ-dependent sugar dehydrogenase [Burkholderiaceae bacterium]|nr:PQQ-dependent sugar dehydrogenase [Burkholderiaceae bacterium]
MRQTRRRQMLWLATQFALATAGGLAACGGGGDSPPAPPPPPTGPPTATTLGVALASPWGLAFLPDGRMLVTQKAGSMVIVRADGSAIDATVSGVPAVNSSGQGGLLDVQLDPDFAADPWVYFTFSEDGVGGAGTALARGQLVGNALQNVAVIWRQAPKVASSVHYGSRIAFRPDKTLYVTLGDRGQDDPANPTTQWAQNVARTQGKVVRLNRDGSLPLDNPVFGAGALPGLWSIGHRNPQGGAVKPGTSDLWLTEHGPQGGDELNRVLAGGNHGWPLVSYGCPYGSPVNDPSCRVGGGTHAPAYEEPKSYWVPLSTAPSGMSFYTGAGFPEWQGHLFIGALQDRTLWRVVLDANDNVTTREEVAVVAALDRRIRHVRQGPDGWLYLLTDDGRIVRVAR